MKTLLLTVLIAGSLFGQQKKSLASTTLYTTGVPSTLCTTSAQYGTINIDYTNNDLYVCGATGWVKSGVSSPVSSIKSSTTLITASLKANALRINTRLCETAVTNATATAASGSGSYVGYIDTDCTMKYSSLATITCSGCTYVNSAAVVPTGAFAFASGTITSGLYNTDFAKIGVPYQNFPVTAGTGITASLVNGVLTLSADIPSVTAQGGSFVGVPWDANFFANGNDAFDTTTTPFYTQFKAPPFNFTVRKLRARFSSGTGSASAGTTFGIYDSNGTLIPNGATTAQILNATSNSFVEFVFAVSPVLSAGGTYYLGMITEQANQAWWQVALGNTAAGTVMHDLWQETSFPRFFKGSTASSGGTGLTLAPPATIGTRTASAALPIYLLLL